MKLYENEKVVKALVDILDENYHYLEYNESESERQSNPKGVKRHKDEKDPDILYVEVVDKLAPRDLWVISDIRDKLTEKTGIYFLTGLAVNAGYIWDSEWEGFAIRRD